MPSRPRARRSIVPTSVRGPVAVTSARPATVRDSGAGEDHRRALCKRCVGARPASVCFAIGSDSPVKADSSTSSELPRRAVRPRHAVARRDEQQISGNDLLGRDLVLARRRGSTSADCVNACESARIARSAPASCQKPSSAVEHEDRCDRDRLRSCRRSRRRSPRRRRGERREGRRAGAARAADTAGGGGARAGSARTAPAAAPPPAR